MILEKLENITLSDLNGQSISINDFKGKNTLIYMWASW
jgi:peroxiredoxin